MHFLASLVGPAIIEFSHCNSFFFFCIMFCRIVSCPKASTVNFSPTKPNDRSLQSFSNSFRDVM